MNGLLPPALEATCEEPSRIGRRCGAGAWGWNLLHSTAKHSSHNVQVQLFEDIKLIAILILFQALLIERIFLARVLIYRQTCRSLGAATELLMTSVHHLGITSPSLYSNGLSNVTASSAHAANILPFQTTECCSSAQKLQETRTRLSSSSCITTAKKVHIIKENKNKQTNKNKASASYRNKSKMKSLIVSLGEITIYNRPFDCRIAFVMWEWEDFVVTCVVCDMTFCETS